MGSNDEANDNKKPDNAAEPHEPAAQASAEPQVDAPPIAPEPAEPPGLSRSEEAVEIPPQTDRRFATRRNLVPAVLDVPPHLSQEPPPEVRAPRMWPLAATIALAASVGAIAGALSTVGVERLLAAPADARSAETRVLKETISRLNADLAGLRSGVDFSAKAVGGQLAKLSERLDRAEKTPAEPAGRLSKLNEAIDRLERRVSAATTAPQPAPQVETTGSIGARLASPLPKDDMRPLIPGWFVRHVASGIAAIQSRDGIIEVGVGDPLPGGGRVEAIRRQDGRWIVVTTRGLILSSQR